MCYMELLPIFWVERVFFGSSYPILPHDWDSPRYPSITRYHASLYLCFIISKCNRSYQDFSQHFFRCRSRHISYRRDAAGAPEARSASAVAAGHVAPWRQAIQPGAGSPAALQRLAGHVDWRGEGIWSGRGWESIRNPWEIRKEWWIMVDKRRVNLMFHNHSGQMMINCIPNWPHLFYTRRTCLRWTGCFLRRCSC